MAQRSLHCLKRIDILIIPLLVLLGCAPASSPAQPAVPPTQTAVAATEAPVQTSLPTEPAISPTQATITAMESPVQISRADNVEMMLKKDETVDLQVNDRIVVPEGGRAVVRVADRLTIDVLRNSEYRLSDVKLEPGNAILVTLLQVRGDSRVALGDGGNARLQLETDFGSVSALQSGTEFLVCHDPALSTCLVVTKGEAEVVGQDGAVTVKSGESTTMGEDGGPISPICANLDDVNAWFDKKLGAGAVQALGELVAGWEQKSCAAPAAEATAVAVSSPQPLPSSEDMVRIEGGEYELGGLTPDVSHIAFLSLQSIPAAFWIDAYEVTNAEYQTFVDQTGHAPPAAWPGKAKYPVQGVTWDDALAYCTWANKRLPSEAEWEAAARGPGSNPPLYPWGNDQSAEGKVDAVPRTGTYEVGAFQFNRSPSGVYDMAGNVWEWVSDPYYPVPEGMKILRGGRFGLIQDMAFRQQAEANSERFVPFAGFRCAADQVQGG